MRIVRLTAVTYDMLKAYSEMIGLGFHEALTHAVVVAYCEEKNKQLRDEDED